MTSSPPSVTQPLDFETKGVTRTDDVVRNNRKDQQDHKELPKVSNAGDEDGANEPAKLVRGVAVSPSGHRGHAACCGAGNGGSKPLHEDKGQYQAKLREG